MWSETTCSCFSHPGIQNTFDNDQADCEARATAGLRGRIAIVDSQTVYDLVRGITTQTLSYVALKPVVPGFNSRPMVVNEWAWYDGDTYVKPLTFLPSSAMDNLDANDGQCLGYHGTGYYEDVPCTQSRYYYCEFVQLSK